MVNKPEFQTWTLPEKVKGGYAIRVVFKTIEEAIRFLVFHNLVGHNSAQGQIEAYEKNEIKEIKRHSTWMKGVFKRFFNRPENR